MSFTGEKAIQFKEAYIAKFNEMESLLISLSLNLLHIKIQALKQLIETEKRNMDL